MCVRVCVCVSVCQCGEIAYVALPVKHSLFISVVPMSVFVRVSPHPHTHGSTHTGARLPFEPQHRRRDEEDRKVHRERHLRSLGERVHARRDTGPPKVEERIGDARGDRLRERRLEGLPCLRPGLLDVVPEIGLKFRSV